MAKVRHGGIETRAKVFRLASSKPAYEFQYLYHVPKCKHCEEELMYWRGEYQNGNFTDMTDIKKADFPYWFRRIKAGEAKPEAQLMSEYSQKIARDASSQIIYQTALCNAKRWYKGQRVKSDTGTVDKQHQSQ